MLPFLWLAALIWGSGCDSPSAPDDGNSGAAAVRVNASALSAADIAEVVVTVSGDGISPDIVVVLAEGPEDQWSGIIEDIPAGADRTFRAEAFDSAGALIYVGTATEVTIEDGATTSVTIYLQEADPPPPFANAVPVITSFTVSPMAVAPGGTVALAVEAADANPDDTLSFLWEAAEGGFSSPAAASTLWFAPDAEGTYEVTIYVSDPHGATANLSAAIGVSTPVGAASVEIVVNNAPEILGLVPDTTRIDEGESTLLNLSARDADGDPLSFVWESDAYWDGDVYTDGDAYWSFDDLTAEDPVFTLHALNPLNGETLTLTVLVEDGRGGSSTASITIQTGPGVTPYDPEIPPAGCEGVIVFGDAQLEAAVHAEIGKREEDIYYADVKDVTALDLVGLSITSLEGLQCLNHLTHLDLSDNGISDISPLAGLGSLVQLNLADNSVSDIWPLAEVANFRPDLLVLEDNPLDCDDAETEGAITILEDRVEEFLHSCIIV
jgi:hypothetical protein